METIVIWLFLVTLLLLLLNALFNSAEVALIGCNKTKIKKLKEDGKKQAEIILKLIERPAEYLSVLIVGITLVITCSTAIITYITVRVLSPKLIPLFAFIWTVIIILFGEIIPKAITLTRVDSIAIRLARITNFCVAVLSPVVRILTLIANMVVKPFKLSIKEEEVATEDEIKILARQGVEEGVIEEEERKMIHGIFKFGDKLAHEIMVPRVDIKALDKDKTIYDAIELFNEYRYSQIPIYEGNIDKIVGVVHIKDLIHHIGNNYAQILDNIKRDAYFVPETKRIIDLFREMRTTKRSLAIILDEYGGTAGLITFEDILEEIVGEIQDEYDKEEPYIKKLSQDSYLIDAKLSVDDANELLHLELLPKENVNTIGGFIYTYLGRIPEKGESFKLNNNVEFTIEEVKEHRIQKVKVKKL